MAALDGKELILGVTGSIAAYKAVYLLRELTALGARATVCLTEHAREFVGPLTFRTLSGRPVLTNLFDPQSSDAVEHVALAERAHAVVIAPATANLLAKAAHGIAPVPGEHARLVGLRDQLELIVDLGEEARELGVPGGRLLEEAGAAALEQMIDLAARVVELDSPLQHFTTLADQIELAGPQLLGLDENLLAHADLAEVVEQRRVADLAQLLR